MTACISCGHSKLVKLGSYKYFSSIFKTLVPGLELFDCENCNLHQVDHSRIDEKKLFQYYRENYRKNVKIAKATTQQSLELLKERGRLRWSPKNEQCVKL